MRAQHTRYRRTGRPKVNNQTVEAVTSNGSDWYTEPEDEETEEDEDTAFRRFLVDAPGANLTDVVLDALVEKRETKLEELLATLQAGADEPGFDDARDVLVNALLVVVLTAMDHVEQDSEEEEEGDGQEEDEEAIAICDVSGTDLFFGDWFHKRGEDYDVCAAEHAKLSPVDRRAYIKVTRLQDLGEDIKFVQHLLEDGEGEDESDDSMDEDEDGL